MHNKLIFALGFIVVAAFVTTGSHATQSAADKARAAANKAAGDAADYVSDKVNRAQHAVHDTVYGEEAETLADKVKHAVKDAAGNIIGGTVKNAGKAGLAAGATKAAYEAAHKLKEKVWDNDEDEDSDPDLKAKNDRLRYSCKQRSSSKAAAEECFKDAKEWNEIDGEVDANGPSLLSRVKQSVGGAYGSAKDYVTGEKHEEKEKKGWL